MTWSEQLVAHGSDEHIVRRGADGAIIWAARRSVERGEPAEVKPPSAPSATRQTCKS